MGPMGEHPNGSPETLEKLQAERARLSSQNAELIRECAELRAERDAVESRWLRIRAGAFWLGTRVLRLQTIERATRDLILAVRDGKGFPVDETAALVAAIVRRIFWIGTVGVILALVPNLISIWQIALLRAQLRDQATSNYVERSGELLNVLTAETCPPDTGGQDVIACVPTHTYRVRRQAVLSILALDEVHAPDVRDFSGTRLDGLPLSGVQMAGAFLDGTILNKSVLVNANLDNVEGVQAQLNGCVLDGASMRGALLDESVAVGARFLRAKLERASFVLADLKNSDFSGAHLSEAHFWGSDLSGADFSDTDLSTTIFRKSTDDTNIRTTPGFREEVLGMDRKKAHRERKQACYDEKTVWPSKFDPEGAGLKRCATTP